MDFYIITKFFPGIGGYGKYIPILELASQTAPIEMTISR